MKPVPGTGGAAASKADTAPRCAGAEVPACERAGASPQRQGGPRGPGREGGQGDGEE